MYKKYYPFYPDAEFDLHMLDWAIEKHINTPIKSNRETLLTLINKYLSALEATT